MAPRGQSAKFLFLKFKLTLAGIIPGSTVEVIHIVIVTSSCKATLIIKGVKLFPSYSLKN